MKLPYNKPHLTFEDQLNQLIKRGIYVSNTTTAISKLSSINYYRLSAYWYPFRQRDMAGKVTDNFIPNTTLNSCFELYEFDRKLRLLVLDALERIEVAIRTQVTYSLSQLYGPFGHINAHNFHRDFDHKKWLHEIEEETERSKEEFIIHYKQKYNNFPELPLWMLTEVMSLGNLSKLYRGMKNDDKRIVAQHFKLHYKRLENWLHTLTYVRNICAHHSRLWNRELGIRPEKVKNKEWLPPLTPRNDRIFYVILILQYLLKIINNDGAWHKKMTNLLEPFAEKVQYRAAMGIPENWQQHPLWQTKSIENNQSLIETNETTDIE